MRTLKRLAKSDILVAENEVRVFDEFGSYNSIVVWGGRG